MRQANQFAAFDCDRHVGRLGTRGATCVAVVGLLGLAACGSTDPGGLPPDYSKIEQAIGEAGCATETANYTGTAGATGYYGTWSSTWHGTNCGGVIAEVGGLSSRDYFHVGAYDYATYPTNQTDCEYSALWGQGLDAICSGSCTGFVNDPNNSVVSNPTLYVGSWNGSSCDFVLYPGFHILTGHESDPVNYKARTVSAALRWNGSVWTPQQSYAGVYVY
ncbi:MAG: hypothetical protein R3B13_37285 [Polyangiaceae bacterium]